MLKPGSQQPASPSVTQRTISSIHHLSLSGVAWRLVLHGADAAKLALESQSHSIHVARYELGSWEGGWPLVCILAGELGSLVATLLPRASPLLSSH